MSKLDKGTRRNARPQVSAAVSEPFDWRWAVALAVLAAVVSIPSLGGGYILDDDVNITDNVTLRSWDGLPRIWTEFGSTQQYYPVTYSTWWLEYRLWQLAPMGYHAMTAAAHVVAVVLVWRLLVVLRVPGAWLAAAIFAVHPVCVESVAWVTELKNTLSLALAVASTLCYLRFDPPDAATESTDTRSVRDSRYYAAALVLFVAAILAKSQVVVLPGVLVVIYWWKRGRVTWRELVPLAPLVVIGLLMSAATVWMENHVNDTAVAELAMSPLERLLIAGRALWFYPAKLLWPYPLLLTYPRWTIDTGQWWQYFYPVAAAVVVWALWSVRGTIGRGPLAAVLIFIGLLLPVLGFANIAFMQFSFVADHFQYHAAVALIALVVAVVAIAVEERVPAGARMLVNVAAVLVVAALAVMSLQRHRLFADSVALYQATLAGNPNSWLAANNLGTFYEHGGEVDKAIPYFEQALRINPKLPNAYFNLATAYYRSGQTERAIAGFEQALRIQPKYPEAFNNLGITLQGAGRMDDAIAQFRKAIEVKPNYAEAHNNLGNALSTAGRPAEAIPCYEEALHLEPGYAEAHDNLGVNLTQVGRSAEAVEHFRQALQINPNSPNTWVNLAAAFVELKKPEQVSAAATKAAQLARAEGDTTRAAHIEAWLTNYERGAKGEASTTPPSGSH